MAEQVFDSDGQIARDSDLAMYSNIVRKIAYLANLIGDLGPKGDEVGRHTPGWACDCVSVGAKARLVISHGNEETRLIRLKKYQSGIEKICEYSKLWH